MTAASTHEVIAFLDQLLEPERFDDYGPNGLQVPGGPDVATVVTGVSAHVELFERAADAGADLVLVHHGLFWRGMPMQVTPSDHEGGGWVQIFQVQGEKLVKETEWFQGYRELILKTVNAAS